MRLDGSNRTRFAARPCMVKLVLGFSGFILAISLAAGSAWSLEPEHTHASDMTAVTLANTLQPEAGDDAASASLNKNSSAGCAYTLEAVRHTPLKRSVDDTRRSAGAAAALGFAFGMRYALTPPGNASLSKDRGSQACS
ncbi:MAG: hypothetical protein LRZ85_05365 [Alphaproteobacteria bacterium]|nr:hypothetical protein [Alphaproteobacteria bacterium]MCD8526586.1 hypothetical protein [Alphaproteobacteria bacterium]